jgi:hypothetical protein
MTLINKGISKNQTIINSNFGLEKIEESLLEKNKPSKLKRKLTVDITNINNPS